MNENENKSPNFGNHSQSNLLLTKSLNEYNQINEVVSSHSKDSCFFFIQNTLRMTNHDNKTNSESRF